MSQRNFCFSRVLRLCVVISGSALIVAGCNKYSSTDKPSRWQGGENQIPHISGIPPTAIGVGASYSFQPSASDPDGDTLQFQIFGLPAWATFDESTGRLTGIPGPADVGTYQNVTIRVSDGITSVALTSFSILVTQISTGTATVSWLPPTQNTDGSPLTDLAGFRIYYGTSPADVSQSVNITNPGVTIYVIENLYPATWYFRVRAYAADGTESAPSNTASKTIQ